LQGRGTHIIATHTRTPVLLYPSHPLACHLFGSIAELKFVSTAGCELEVSDRREKNNYKMIIRGPLSLVSTTEELLDRKVAAPV
jgi:hypothetical protein